MEISPEVEIALNVAANDASRRRHEYVTIEHLLYALLLDETTANVIRHAGGDPPALKKRLDAFLTEQLEPLSEESSTPPTPSLGVHRAIRRAYAHVKSSGKQEVTGANVIIAMFAERDSFAINLLEEQGVTKLDVASYISHGTSKISEDPAEARGAVEAEVEGPRPAKDPLKAYTLNLKEEQPAARRRRRRRQDRDRRGPGAQDPPRRGPCPAQGGDRLFARHGLPARRYALSRRLRRAHQGRHQGPAEDRRSHSLHRRDPHDHRRGRDRRRQYGRQQSPQAGARERQAPLHRVDHVPGVQAALRERPGPRPPVPARRGQ